LLAAGLALLALACAAWLWRDAPWMRPLRALAWSATDGSSHPAAALRKCVQQGKVLYTDGACPQGSQSQPVDGALTVVPAVQASAAAAAVKPLPGKVRDVLVPPGAGDLKDQRMEAAIGK
jgi:hypothetical protein